MAGHNFSKPKVAVRLRIFCCCIFLQHVDANLASSQPIGLLSAILLAFQENIVQVKQNVDLMACLQLTGCFKTRPVGKIS